MDPSSRYWLTKSKGTPEPREALLKTASLLSQLLDGAADLPKFVLDGSILELCKLLDSLSMLQAANHIGRNESCNAHRACRTAHRLASQFFFSGSNPESLEARSLHNSVQAPESVITAMLLAICRAHISRTPASFLRIETQDSPQRLHVSLQFGRKHTTAGETLLARDGMHFVHTIIFGLGGEYELSVGKYLIKHNLSLPAVPSRFSPPQY